MDNKLSELSKPVAEVVSKFGDPEAFGEREIKLLTGIQQMAYGTKFYSQEYVSALDGVAQFWIGESAGWKKRAEDAEKRTASLQEVAVAMREWIDAVPSEVAASLPTMPGVDRDWVDEVIDACRAAMLAQPVSSGCKLAEGGK
ncbi:hypothetical protein SME23J_32290 [Serratia marcescens]|nr:hypothetical protein SME23J_32290 [Serratia marcescens]